MTVGAMNCFMHLAVLGMFCLPTTAWQPRKSATVQPERLLRAKATTAAESAADDEKQLRGRSIDFLVRERRNLQALEKILERNMEFAVDKAGETARAAETTAKVQAIEKALLFKLSEEDPFPALGQGSLARRELDLPPSRVMVTGPCGVLAGLIYGKLQRVTGTGATNNAGLKHPNALATSPNCKGALNRLMAGRFAGAGCWHEVTELGGVAYDKGFSGVMSETASAIAGDERPFVLVPRDGCDVVVLGSRYGVTGSFEWGFSLSLDHALDAASPEENSIADLGSLSDKSTPPRLTHEGILAGLLAAAVEGLRPKERASYGADYIAEQHAKSSTRGPVAHLVLLLHPADSADPAALASHAALLEETRLPFTLVALGGGAGVSTDVTWVARKDVAAGSPGRPPADLREPVRVAIRQAADYRDDREAVAGIAVSAGQGGVVAQESIAEVLVQTLLLLDANQSRIVTISPGRGAEEKGLPGAVFPEGVTPSEEVLRLLKQASEGA